jgi:hypothetical protein
VSVKLRALHEGDVLDFIDALAASRQGFYPVDRCVMRAWKSRTRCAAAARRGRLHPRVDHDEGEARCVATILLALALAALPPSRRPRSCARSSTARRNARGSIACGAASPEDPGRRARAAHSGGHRIREAQRWPRHRVARRHAEGHDRRSVDASTDPSKVRDAQAPQAPAIEFKRSR